MAEPLPCDLCARAIPPHAHHIVRIDVFADPAMPPLSQAEVDVHGQHTRSQVDMAFPCGSKSKGENGGMKPGEDARGEGSFTMKSKNADLLDVGLELQDDIRWAYRQHEEHRPVMLYDIQERLIYAYPYQDYKATLSQRSQAMLAEEYEAACAENQMVVFVRDNATRRLISFSLDCRESRSRKRR